MKKTNKPVKEEVKFITPVPYWHIDNERRDLVIVSLEQLIEAQKNHEQEIEKARKEGFLEGYNYYPKRLVKDLNTTDK